MLTTSLGCTIEAPARVAVFVFADHLAFMNYATTPAEVRLRGLNWDEASLESDAAKTAVSGDRLFLAPGSYALLKRSN